MSTGDGRAAGGDPAARPPAPSRPSPAEPAGPRGMPLLSTSGLTKRFGAVEALSSIDLEIPAGQVTALVGDNGAGKSTLIKTISGIWEPDLGEVHWDGQRVRVRGPKEAAALGIATVYQDLALCDNLDIVQNMFLGRELLQSRLLDETNMEKAARQTLSDLSVTTVRSIRQPVGSLSGGQRQAVAVARAVMQNARLVIMDEPTAALGVSQTAMVLELISTLRSRGIAVLIISHNLNDVFAVADRIAVLYLGRLAACAPVSEFDTQSAVQAITTGTVGDQAVATSERAV
jgi:ABC-type sugar transport system ATPase subunit